MDSTEAKLCDHIVIETTYKFRHNLSNGVALPACSTTPEATLLRIKGTTISQA
jgi:hypothetical protein